MSKITHNLIGVAAMLMIAATPGAVAAADAPGFPFAAGRYVIDGDCDATDINFAIVDFTARYSHEYEADGNVEFGKVKKISDDEYSIVENWPVSDGYEPYKVEARYLRTGPDSFRRTVKEDRDSFSDDYTYCAPTTAVGAM